MATVRSVEQAAASALGVSAEAGARPRLDSVDLLRGAVMVLMVLDHTRDFFTDLRVNPTDPSATTPALFLTRWVTHFCAPVFAFLAGSGAFLAGRRERSRAGLAVFLVTRGFWLVLLELTVAKLGLMFRLAPGRDVALVLWAIGWSLVALAPLVWLPARVVGLLGVVMIATHNLADGLDPDRFGAWRPLVLILHQPGLIRTETGWSLFVLYPLVPWVGVVMAGYGFGEVLGLDPGRRRATALALGLGLTAAFVALRASNVYGDPRPWSGQATGWRTAVSFLNCQKYPPSLLFLLMTLGPALAALSAIDRGAVPGAVARPLVTLGRVPLFFYLLQWYVIHGLALLLAVARGQPTGWLFPQDPPPAAPPECAYGLPFVDLMWVVVLALLYPVCRAFARLKQRRRDAWLSYL